MLYIKLIVKKMHAKKSRYFLIMLSIFISVLLMGIVTAYYDTARYTEDMSRLNRYGDYEIEIRNVDRILLERFIGDKRIAGISSYSIQKQYEILDANLNIKDRYNENAIILLAEYNEYKKGCSIHDIVIGRAPDNEFEIMIDSYIYEQIKQYYSVGSKVYLKQIDNSENGDPYIVSGVYNSKTNITGRENFYYFVNGKNEENPQYYNIFLSIPNKSITAADNIIKQYYSDWNVLKMNNSIIYNITLSKNNSSFIIVYIFLMLITSISTSFNITNILNVETNDQKMLYGLLNIIGATPSQLKKIALVEIIIISILAIPAGIVVSLLLSQIVIGNLYEGNHSYFHINKYTFMLTSLIAFLSIFIAAKKPAKRASQTEAIEAIKNISGTISNPGYKYTYLYSLIRRLHPVMWLAYSNFWRNKRRVYISIATLIMVIVIFISFNYFGHLQRELSISKAPDFIISVTGSPRLDNILSEINKIDGTSYIKDNNIFPPKVTMFMPSEKKSGDWIKNSNGEVN